MESAGQVLTSEKFTFGGLRQTGDGSCSVFHRYLDVADMYASARVFGRQGGADISVELYLSAEREVEVLDEPDQMKEFDLLFVIGLDETESKQADYLARLYLLEDMLKALL